ncbi:uncharacterized protein K460DRAFT_352691 [Cucurbitaria berberidis CBS 394.84]|uniref:Uncharacterized protein n=1 Tax=Cucurbitaria berberidis CBS 394.84 TaxID=1168544 RepID=A0A9P4GM34_9PLEO|nr:uncharacterized protein K460DRAFT_352691 [Cucurbitaria berberidis CBS 394.84]KAF1847571.1 hypothetical protein K460DRAFT_352691 [Cucurbitaria berberidis CBS 394.84]
MFASTPSLSLAVAACLDEAWDGLTDPDMQPPMVQAARRQPTTAYTCFFERAWAGWGRRMGLLRIRRPEATYDDVESTTVKPPLRADEDARPNVLLAPLGCLAPQCPSCSLPAPWVFLHLESLIDVVGTRGANDWPSRSRTSRDREETKYSSVQIKCCEREKARRLKVENNKVYLNFSFCKFGTKSEGWLGHPDEEARQPWGLVTTW